jgi:hypothetical protein
MNLLIRFFFLLFFANIYSQEFEISGKLVDEKNNPLENIEVLIFENDKVKGSGITDSMGNFVILIEPGLYKMRCYFVGSVIYATDFEFTNSLHLGTLTSFDNTNTLKEVEVSGKKKVIETKVDRTVFNVENSVRSTGSDGYQLLKGTPGVAVQGNSIKLVGKSTVSVMIDDRMINLSGDDLANYLRNLSSDQIKSIEVITTPPAKYAADGNSGLINIQLKKAPVDSWAVNLRTNYIQTSYPTFAGGIGFTFNKKKLTLVADFVKQEGSIKTLETVDTKFTSENWESRTNRRDYTDVYRGIFGFDYKLTEKANVGFKYTGVFNKPDIDDYNHTSIFDKNTNQLETLISTNGYNNSTTDNNSINVYFIQKLDTIGKLMTIDFDAFNYQDSQNRTFSSTETNVATNVISDLINANNIGTQDLTNFSGKIDFEIPTKWANYSFGGKLSWIDNTSDIQFFTITNGTYVIDPNQTNIFQYTENTQALYFSANKSLGEKWQAQVGLRYETTQTKGVTAYLDNTQNETNKFNYDQLFPTAYLMYTANENNNYSISYSKRVGRPDYWALNPYKWYLSPFEIVQGNPYLQPSFTDNVELTFNHKENWSFKLYYSNTTNGNSQINFVDLNENPPITFLIQENFYDLATYGGNISYYFAKLSWWESSNSLSGYYNQTTFIKEIVAEKQDGFSYGFGTYNTFTLNKKKNFFGEINFNYNAPVFSIFNEITSYHRLDLGFRYTLQDKGWNFIIYGSDLTRGSLTYTNSVINNTPQSRSIYYDERSVRIGVTYKFGNRKLRANTRESSNEEEKNRIR